MRNTFPLFHSHLDLAHYWWERLVQSGDHVVDATAGNGHDTLKLCQLVLTGDSGAVWGLDVQTEALDQTLHLLQSQLSPLQMEHVVLRAGCHSTLPEGPFQLIVYNLGYLPGGDKKLTTQEATTLASLWQAAEKVSPGGAISVTCYPGHPQGEIEERTILSWASDLDPKEWNICHHRWVNREKSPSLLLLQKKKER